jgi:hypothetical protein
MMTKRRRTLESLQIPCRDRHHVGAAASTEKTRGSAASIPASTSRFPGKSSGFRLHARGTNGRALIEDGPRHVHRARGLDPPGQQQARLATLEQRDGASGSIVTSNGDIVKRN